MSCFWEEDRMTRITRIAAALAVFAMTGACSSVEPFDCVQGLEARKIVRVDEAIPDRYVVVMKASEPEASIASRTASAEAFAGSFSGVSNLQVYGAALDGFRAPWTARPRSGSLAIRAWPSSRKQVPRR